MVIIGKIYETKRPSSEVGKIFNFKLNIYNKIRPIKNDGRLTDNDVITRIILSQILW